MRTRLSLASAATVMLGLVADVQAQWVYTRGAPAVAYPRGYSFRDEPVMSINNSYLGYGNFTYYGPTLAPRFLTGNKPYQSPGYTYAPARRVFRPFGWRRGYRY
jgi:hypothetical protein